MQPRYTVLRTLLLGALLVSGLPVSVFAGDHVPYEELAGTIWMSEAPHTRTTVSSRGAVELKEGKDIYIEFLSLTDGVYTIKVHWWNLEVGINVVEYGVLVRDEPNEFTYIEADHPAASGFPGIAGYGSFELIDADTAEFSQLGRLADGSASAFENRLKRVDKAPEVPIPQTYPRIE